MLLITLKILKICKALLTSRLKTIITASNLAGQGFRSFIPLLDIILVVMVFSFFINDFFNLYFSLFDKICSFTHLNEAVYFMSNNASNVNTVTNTTNTQIIHDDGSWSNAIRSLFIYGSGGYRLHLMRGGSPSSRFLIVSGSVIADQACRVINKAINDPKYIRKHINALNFSSEGPVASVNINQGGSVDQAISQAQAEIALLRREG